MDNKSRLQLFLIASFLVLGLLFLQKDPPEITPAAHAESQVVRLSHDAVNNVDVRSLATESNAQEENHEGHKHPHANGELTCTSDCLRTSK